MTTRTLVFDSPFLLGFESMQALIERAAKAADEGYPPYNVEQIDDRRLHIVLAVAGFSSDQLQVTVEGRQLTVAARREEDARPQSATYLHRGIAARSFQRTFVLADGLEVEGAELAHGLLHIDVVRRDPERRTVQIPIRAAG